MNKDALGKLKFKDILSRKNLVRLGLVGISLIFLLSACAPPTTPSSLTASETIATPRGETLFIEASYTDANTGQRVYLGFPGQIGWSTNNEITEVRSPNSLSHPCNADPGLLSEAQSKDPWNYEDLRKTLCDNYEDLARQIGLPESQISLFSLYMAANTFIISSSDSSVCADGAAACEQNGFIITKPEGFSKLPHEVTHSWLSKIPEGVVFLPNQNVCMIHRNEVISLIYHDQFNSTDLQAELSRELLPVLQQVDASPNNFDDYLVDPNSALTEQIREYASTMTPVLNYLIPDNVVNGKPQFSDLIEVIKSLISHAGVEKLVEADQELQKNVSSFFPGQVIETPAPSLMIPEQACSQ